MSAEATLWLTFIAIGLASTLPRASFIVPGGRVRLPPVLQRALRYAPAAALAAIVV
ncbi:MAG: AzlD domain-containing protein, partial [Polynucleobacter sp.]|nr:AzlD domain-containing protein [Polynucleobacter sp.]